jgi:hypothetical protein
MRNARLYRPHIPLDVRCLVVLRQLGEMWPDEVIRRAKTRPGDAYLKGVGVFVERKGLAALLGKKLNELAVLLDCKREDLRLDHDPPLGARDRKGEGKKTVYDPPANDPAHLIYREKHAHLIKTNVRGEHGQHPDRVLIKRARKRQKKLAKTTLTLWPKRPLQSANRWPPKGSRKIGI